MNKLIVVGALTLSPLVFAQHGNGGDKGQHQNNATNVPSNSHNKQNGHANEHGNPGQHNDKITHAVGDQGRSGNQGAGKQGGGMHGGNQGGGMHGGNQGGGKQGGNQGGGQNHGNNAVNNQGHGNPGNGKNKHHNGDNGHSANGDKGNQHHGNGNINKHHYGKITHGHPNYGYVYMNKHGVFSHSNYGQWRSHQARNKHKKYHPEFEYLAVEGFNLIITRNQFLYTEIDYKINLLRSRLSDRRRSGVITEAVYANSMRSIVVLERRRAAVNINIQL